MADNYFGITDTGRMRSNNEDTFIAERILDDKLILACVIDGVGGYEGGEVASAVAREAILRRMRTDSGDRIVMIKEAIAAANDAIYNEKVQTKSNDQMACVLTLALVDVANNKFFYGHVGDTRLYLLRDHSLIKVTRDHSFVGFLEDSGRLSEEAAMRHPKRNEINKALGFDAQIKSPDYIETGESPFLPTDSMLLCSDGLTDMVSNSEMTGFLTSDKSLADKAKLLVKAANDAGGKDNITVVLVHNDKAPTKQTATKPSPYAKKNDSYEPVQLKSEEESRVDIRQRDKNERKSSLVPLLVIFCVLLVGAVGWLVYQNYYNDKKHKEQVASTVMVKERNPEEQRLVDSIHSSTTGEVFLLNQAGSPSITITDSIPIDRDSLHILGNGATLVSDTAFKGAAFTLSSRCKYILIDSLTIENFDIGILAQNEGLQLKNVQFKNCRVPVQYQFMFKDRPIINGRFADTTFYNTDKVQP